jgi:nucleotide-binding universal stress UspA family protein
MVESILIPVDDSEMSNRALEYAITEIDAEEFRALNVVDPRQVHAPGGIESAHVSREELLEMHRQKGADILEDAEATAAEHGVEIETDIAEGDISRTILDYAEEHDIDHVVIGSHGRTGASRILLGSVAESVTRRSPVPVTVVR